MTELEQYANSLGQLLREKAWRLVTAESCTGGWIAQTVTSVNGSSDWFDCGFVSYSNTSKQALLGVKTETLEQYGAVSKPVVLEMVQGAISQSQTQVGIAISGIAGPGGGTEDKPVGTVWIAYILPNFIVAKLYHFTGNRQEIRQASVKVALIQLLEYVKNYPDI